MRWSAPEPILLVALLSALGCASDDAPFLVNVETRAIALSEVETLALQLAPGSLSEAFSEQGTGSFYDGGVRTRVAPGGELVITIDRDQLAQWVTDDSGSAFAASIPLQPGGGGGGPPTLNAFLFSEGNVELGRGGHSLPWPLPSGDSVRVQITAP